MMIPHHKHRYLSYINPTLEWYNVRGGIRSVLEILFLCMIQSSGTNDCALPPSSHKEIMESQVQVLKEQKKRILDLVMELQSRSNDNRVIEAEIEQIMKRHKGSEPLRVREEGWKLVTYVKGLEDEYSLTLDKLSRRDGGMQRSNPSSEENLEVGDISLGLNQEVEPELRHRNFSASSAQISEISTDNDEVGVCSYPTKDMFRVGNMMIMSGLTMRKQKISKYKVAQTFYDTRVEEREGVYIIEESEEVRVRVQEILDNHRETEGIRKQLIQNCLVIPHSLRERVWNRLIGDHFEIPKSYYLHLEQKAKMIDPLSQKLIANDITRTFPELKFFNESPKMLDQLRALLEMFQAHNSRIGYVQGMAHIASILLLVYQEEKAFQSFNNLVVGWSFIKNIYSFHERDYQFKLETLNTLVNQFIPRLSKRIPKSQLQLLMIQWFFSIFSRNLNINVAIKLWDLIIIHGEYMFFSISVGILKTFTEQILSVPEDEVYLKVKQLTLKMDFETIHGAVMQLGLTSKDYQSAMQRVASSEYYK